MSECGVRRGRSPGGRAMPTAVAAAALLDFLVNGNLLEVGVEFLQLQTLRVVLLVLGGDVTARTRNARRLLLRALEDHLYPISFLCHCG